MECAGGPTLKARNLRRRAQSCLETFSGRSIEISHLCTLMDPGITFSFYINPMDLSRHRYYLRSYLIIILKKKNKKVSCR